MLVKIDENTEILKEIDLNNIRELAQQFEDEVKDSPFQKMSISDRCLTFKGTTYNYETGFSWDFNMNNIA